jgi:S-adenosylmethionine:tRNA ribosyltransferase-isomerase
MMHTENYNYNLPSELIAQYPLLQRDSCRLLALEKMDRAVTHTTFSSIKKLLKAGDRLVFNNTRVIPARLFGAKENGVPIEFLFTEEIDKCRWKVIAKPAKRLKEGTVVTINNCESARLHIEKVISDGSRVVRLETQTPGCNIESLLERYGHFPLPPYICREDDEGDRDNYQTVFASKAGAIASPTAGLHFTDQLIDELKKGGIDVSFVTLHVGVGTFRPVKVDDPRKHDIHEEYFELSSQAANEIMTTKVNGGRIVAVGTTVVRVLEHCAKYSDGVLGEMSGKTKLLILPPYEFKIISGLITNFHLPKSTLLMLVSAFSGREFILEAYQEAIREKYRFFSYGDAMIIL